MVTIQISSFSHSIQFLGCKDTDFSEDKEGRLDFYLYLCAEYKIVINEAEEIIVFLVRRPTDAGFCAGAGKEG